MEKPPHCSGAQRGATAPSTLLQGHEVCNALVLEARSALWKKKKKMSDGINGMEINDEIQSFSELCLALFEIRTFLKAG